MNYQSLKKVLDDANDLIHGYRNNPGHIMNNARQVDPVIHRIRVAIYEIEQKIKGDLK
jgi:hypothetical protein